MMHYVTFAGESAAQVTTRTCNLQHMIAAQSMGLCTLPWQRRSEGLQGAPVKYTQLRLTAPGPASCMSSSRVMSSAFWKSPSFSAFRRAA